MESSTSKTKGHLGDLGKLPRKVKDGILKHLGIFHKYPIIVDKVLKSSLHPMDYIEDGLRDRFRSTGINLSPYIGLERVLLPVNFLRTCKLIHRELFEAFYSENTFLVYNDQTSVKWIQGLPTLAWLNITNLILKFRPHTIHWSAKNGYKSFWQRSAFEARLDSWATICSAISGNLMIHDRYNTIRVTFSLEQVYDIFQVQEVLEPATIALTSMCSAVKITDNDRNQYAFASASAKEWPISRLRQWYSSKVYSMTWIKIHALGPRAWDTAFHRVALNYMVNIKAGALVRNIPSSIQVAVHAILYVGRRFSWSAGIYAKKLFE
ncbi:hypothetical protein BT63DRAFT_412663 [Microthyrium microscopicum]|uniref:Uncharacterized protein n=1 Tax=Microthyrium microscopicum TaxID=703497 RepID=A0A6A6UE95_9PEZI|nr:hypothetical protein BT63DRAFT_412663 [Microthyrium microscopicum]